MIAMHKQRAYGRPMLAGDLVRGPIVVGVEESDTDGRPFATALDLARRNGNQLVVVSAYRPLRRGELRVARREAPPDVAWSLGPDAATRTLHEDLRERAADVGLTIGCVARQGSPAHVIVCVATEEQAGLVVVGGTEPHARRHLHHGVSDEVSRHAPCPVLIVDTSLADAA